MKFARLKYRQFLILLEGVNKKNIHIIFQMDTLHLVLSPHAELCNLFGFILSRLDFVGVKLISLLL